MKMPTMTETIKKNLDSLIHEDTKDEDIALIGEIKKSLDEYDEQYMDLAEKSQSIRSKYIQLIQSGNFGTGEGEVKSSPTPRTDEEIINDIISRRNKQ